MSRSDSTLSASKDTVRLARRVAAYETVTVRALMKQLLLSQVATYTPTMQAAMLADLTREDEPEPTPATPVTAEPFDLDALLAEPIPRIEDEVEGLSEADLLLLADPNHDLDLAAMAAELERDFAELADGLRP